MTLDLPLIWAGLIALSILIYIILDGFDLGVGLLFPFEPGESERDLMMNSVAPVWDGNETWLIMGGGGLFAVFPLAYATALPALYAPLLAMLLALVFRGVAFEYRWRTTRWKRVWDVSFFAGSFIATFAQGIALGALVQGIEIENRAYAGGWWDWLTPFSLLCGVALIFGYALLGATWLNMKLEGAVQERMRYRAGIAAAVTVGFIVIVSLITPFIDEIYFARWFAWPSALYSSAVPILCAGAIAALYYGLKKHHDVTPFLASLTLFTLCFIGLGIGFYPYIVPHSLTIAEAAAPDSSLLFTLVGASILLPLILGYTAYAYWVFRGKLDPDEGYH